MTARPTAPPSPSTPAGQSLGAMPCSVLPVPFYRDEYVTIYHGDCRKIMPLLERFDLLMADPPYGISEDGKRSNRNRKGDGKWKAPSNKDYGANDWDDETVPGWLMELAREICDKQIIFGGNYYALPPAKGWIVWDKETDGKNGADCELAWSNALTSTKRIKHLWDGFRQKTLETREHPTQKPLAVIQWAIMQAGDVETILDPGRLRHHGTRSKESRETRRADRAGGTLLRNRSRSSRAGRAPISYTEHVIYGREFGIAWGFTG
jgi:hypothetical protein